MLASLASLATCHPPRTGGFAGGIGVSIKAPQKKSRTYTHIACMISFADVHGCAKRREVQRTYLGMENRDAASFFLIFLHSVDHLGGDVR